MKFYYNHNGSPATQDYTAANTADLAFNYSSGGTLDPLGRLRSFTDGIGTTNLSYQPIDNTTVNPGGMASINGPWANETFNYVPGVLTGSRNWKNDANAALRTESATADLLGRLTSSTAGGDTTTVLYGAANNSSRPASSTINSIQTSYGFYPSTAGTKAFSLQSLTHSSSSNVLASHTYDYDNRGNLSTWNQQSGSKIRNNAYIHSRTDELTDSTQTDANGALLKKNTYRYDAGGNRLSSGNTNPDGSQPTTLSQHNNRNQLKTIGGAGTTLVEGTVDEKSKVTVNGLPAKLNSISNTGLWKYERTIDVVPGSNTVAISATDASGNTRTQSYNFTVGPITQTLNYDFNGNMLTDGARTYTWDAADRLLTISSGTHLTEFTYDGMSRRVKIVEKENGSIVTAKRYQWEGYTILAELDDTTGAIERQYYSHGFDILTGPKAGKYSYLRDHLGSIREVLDASRTVRATYDYDPYGQRTKLSGDIDADFGFTGHYTHAASGLLLAPFRAYDPKLGRWISEDPIGEKGGMNLYGYVGGGVLASVDQLGWTPYALTDVDSQILEHAWGGESMHRFRSSVARLPYPPIVVDLHLERSAGVNRFLNQQASKLACSANSSVNYHQQVEHKTEHNFSIGTIAVDVDGAMQITSRTRLPDGTTQITWSAFSFIRPQDEWFDFEPLDRKRGEDGYWTNLGGFIAQNAGLLPKFSFHFTGDINKIYIHRGTSICGEK